MSRLLAMTAAAQHWRRSLSDQAMHMLAEAGGLPGQVASWSADMKNTSGTMHPGISVHAFDINGYVASDIAWFSAVGGPVLLLVPGDVLPVREYVDLAGLRAGIRVMVQSAAGRLRLAGHFPAHCRAASWAGNGVDRWLADIATGGHDRRIACLRAPFEGDIGAVLRRHLPVTVPRIVHLAP